MLAALRVLSEWALVMQGGKERDPAVCLSAVQYSGGPSRRGTYCTIKQKQNPNEQNNNSNKDNRKSLLAVGKTADGLALQKE